MNQRTNAMHGMRMMMLASLLTAAACGGDDEETAAGVLPDSTRLAQEGAAATRLLTPIRALSLAEVEFADLAAQRAGMPAVRQYAQTVAADHRALIGVLDSVAQTRSVTLTATQETQELANTSRMAHSGLQGLAGAEFDLPFVRAEVESHRLLLDRLDQQLVPAAPSPDLRTLLTDIRAMADAHLARARQLLAQQLGESAVPESPAGTRDMPSTQPPPSRPPPPADSSS